MKFNKDLTSRNIENPVGLKPINQNQQKLSLNVALIDSSPLAALGLEHGLDKVSFNINVVSTTDNFQQLENDLTHKKIDIVFLGLLVIDEQPFYSIKQVYRLKARWPDVKFVLYTEIKNKAVLQYLSYMQLDAILSRSDCLNDLQNNIIEIINKKFFCSNTCIGDLTQNAMSHRSVNRVMTHNEIEVLDRLSLGESVSEIAIQSQRSIKTVSNHKRNAMSKLGIKTDWELHLFIISVVGKIPIYTTDSKFSLA
ncbi:response regulator transcription factor [Yersinia mollaretii]|uniref:response regulator transcription factor n=1 Tax=Yersinia mollaretii TaxID=33060 RepID=UPI0005E652A8|nr:response regulator transcription factor [Yersinia mollaretii]CNJ22103.1 transcriptional regulator RcsB [Yersinia mollaretii]CQR09441.1 transcriptional regulator RcsB [Yersinia mollaretii]